MCGERAGRESLRSTTNDSGDDNGDDDDEIGREIAREVQARARGVRIHTLGIGVMCNWYFLKVNFPHSISIFCFLSLPLQMVSYMSRGFSFNVLSEVNSLYE